MFVSNGSTRVGALGNTKRAPLYNKCFFTFNNYTEKDIEALLASIVSEKYCFQEERGSNDTPHLQGCIWFAKRVRPSEYINFTNKIHWEKCKNWDCAVRYCSKSETRCGRQWYNVDIPEDLECLTDDSLYDWQANIVAIIKQKPDCRLIYYYWEAVGNVGKSEFTKYLCIKHNAVVLSGKGTDMKYAVSEMVNKRKKPPKIIVIDIPRSNQGFVSWTGIEEIKNGCFFSAKYESEMVVYNRPHIIVFSNHEPPYDKLSVDKWKVVSLHDHVI